MRRAPVPSLFESFRSVAGDRVKLVRLSKATLADLSHVLEDLLVERNLSGVVLTGFQQGKNWLAELERYESLATESDRTVAVFTDDALPSTMPSFGFLLPKESGLRQEWFILAQTPECACAMFGVDHPESEAPVIEEMDRVFDATWTFAPDVVSDLAALVVDVAERTDPERARVIGSGLDAVGIREATPAFEQEFNARIFETLEHGRRRLRRSMLREQALRERLQEANERILRLARLSAVGTMAASLAHEINNPLQAIGFGAEAIEEDALRGPEDGEPETERVEAWADALADEARRIAKAAARIGRMTRGILDLVRVSEPRVEPLDLRAWLAPVAEELETVLRRPVRVDGGAGCLAHADADRLQHIVSNLVTNAAQADPDGAPVVIRLGRDGRGVTIRVIDSGPGIPPEFRQTLFEPFVTSKAGQGGTGLGLALARRFAEDMGARWNWRRPARRARCSGCSCRLRSTARGSPSRYGTAARSFPRGPVRRWWWTTISRFDPRSAPCSAVSAGTCRSPRTRRRRKPCSRHVLTMPCWRTSTCRRTSPGSSSSIDSRPA